ncbi:hypothetical protein [Leifsonia xyli]|uniref:hypothetical protein n=1 Tax=Leifsonia xyli TaxID=1575 RepID=UPI003D67508B
MGNRIAFGLSHLAPIDNPATVGGHGEILTAIFVILGVLIVILLIGFGVTLARRPDKQLDEWGNATGAPPAPPPH